MGQNWWCVLFPSLCDIGIEQESVAAASDGQVHKEKGGIEIFGCRIKLRILEFLVNKILILLGKHMDQNSLESMIFWRKVRIRNFAPNRINDLAP